MAAMAGFEMGLGNIPPAAFASITMDGDEYVRCSKCGYGGCDVRISGCGCTLHSRCMALLPNGSIQVCPQCAKPTQGLSLFPMSFREIDDARKAAATPASKKRKRKAEQEEKSAYVSERRTGRWTNEEMAYCDKLIAKFETGELPITDGVKLNEFLGSMLKSKQSRLTKKMKNAKLSSKSFQRTSGHLEAEESREFSDLEDAFFQAITDPLERAEMKFHMQKEWRELFSRICASVGQHLDADAWLSSVEEMDRRASQARDSARMAKRKTMMGIALRMDTQNPDSGVFIERTQGDNLLSGGDDMEDELLAILADDKAPSAIDVNGKSSLLHSAPFLSKAIAYLQRHMVPFEHMDLWVPSFVSGSHDEQQRNSCRLCYAGSATVETIVAEDGAKTRSLAQDEQFNLFAFGDYSQKFSFDVGCGLPGRVYESGRPTWEQSVQNAPHEHFERCGGAYQWGIKTVVGIPIASPNVGRIVVTLYSIHDRPKDEELVVRLSEEFTRLMPSPKWKLVVDIGDVEETVSVPISTAASGVAASTADSDHTHERLEDSKDPSAQPSAVGSDFLLDERNMQHMAPAAATPGVASASSTEGRDPRVDAIVALLGEFMPSDPHSPLSPFINGFMSLRLLLLRPSRTPEDEERVHTILESYSSYENGGRQRSEIAVMLARDYMYLSQQNGPQQHHHHQQQASMLSLGDPLMQGAARSGHMSAQSNSTGLSLFGLPSTSSSLQNSPALAPIPAPGNHDSMSIVSN